jgi:hypothetical protein
MANSPPVQKITQDPQYTSTIEYIALGYSLILLCIQTPRKEKKRKHQHHWTSPQNRAHYLFHSPTPWEPPIFETSKKKGKKREREKDLT